MFNLDLSAIDRCDGLQITASSCTAPYTYSWSYTSNSSTSSLDALILTANSQNSAILTIPPETLEFGKRYDFTVDIHLLNDDPYTPSPTISFTTAGGTDCVGSVTFPTFSVSHNGNNDISKNDLI